MVGPMRVLHLCAGNLYGGVERIVVECAASRALCPSVVPAVAVCYDGRLAGEIDTTGVACARLGEVKASRPHTIIKARRALARVLDAERPDAVIGHSSWMFALAAPVVRARGTTLALWIHDRVSGRPWPERWARLTSPDVVISNSRFTDASVPAMYPSSPRTVLYAPVSPGDDLPRAERETLRRSLGVDDGVPVILIASRFEAWKGHRELIAAASEMSEPWRIWIAGRPQRDGERAYERSLGELARARGVAGRVQFLGERADVPALMRAADIHCQPNTGPEPFGLAFVEALYAALPVVASASGGALEIVTDECGVLVPAGDSAQLAAVLARLVNDPSERRRLGSAGPARARELCDPFRQLGALAGILAGARSQRVFA